MTKKRRKKATASRAIRDRRIHLHIENHSPLGEVFEASRKRVNAALRDHPALKDRLKITVGYDGDIFGRAIATAEILFAWDFDREDLAARAPQLRWVHAHGAGVNHLGVWAVPTQVEKLVRFKGCSLAQEKERNIARVVEIIARPITGADPKRLSIDGHVLGVLHPGVGNEARAVFGNVGETHFHMGPNRQAFYPR